ncbi:MAG TPA: hypothetical protein VGI26_11330 [Solirubrobacteraceae bacterium]
MQRLELFSGLIVGPGAESFCAMGCGECRAALGIAEDAGSCPKL